VDHIVIGPGGVFTINSKFHEGGSIWVGSRRLLVNGQRTDHLRNAEFEARRVAKVLTQAAGEPVDVTPIIAIVEARRITIKERPEHVIVVSSRQLVSWLKGRSTVVNNEQVTRLVEIAENGETWGHPSVPTADLADFAVLRENVATARHRRRAWALAVLLTPFLILATGALSLFR
jgi:hypothetical protein